MPKRRLIASLRLTVAICGATSRGYACSSRRNIVRVWTDALTSELAEFLFRTFRGFRRAIMRFPGEIRVGQAQDFLGRRGEAYGDAGRCGLIFFVGGRFAGIG